MATLYETVLPTSWSGVPRGLRRVHEAGESAGTFAVERGSGRLASLLASACGLPPAAAAVPIHLRVTSLATGQRWERTFGSRRLVSHQYSTGAELVERFGIVECRLAVEARGGILTVRSTGAGLRVGPLRATLPAWIAPVITGTAAADGDAVAVDVSIHTGWRALLLRYHGRVRRVESA